MNVFVVYWERIPTCVRLSPTDLLVLFFSVRAKLSDLLNFFWVTVIWIRPYLGHLSHFVDCNVFHSHL